MDSEIKFAFGLDTETTGLKVDKGDRVIEFYGVVYRIADRKQVLKLGPLLFSNEGQKINAKAQEVHGISAADLIGKQKFKDFAPKLDKVFQSKPLVIAHNIAFDIGFIVHHMAEAGFNLPADLQLYDTMEEGMTASYDAKPPSLREFCWAMGVPYNPDEAHAAEYDVDVMMDAFFAGIDRGYISLPETAEDMKEAA